MLVREILGAFSDKGFAMPKSKFKKDQLERLYQLGETSNWDISRIQGSDDRKIFEFYKPKPQEAKSFARQRNEKEKERISSKRTQDEVLDELKKAEERSPIANSPFGNEIAISNNPTVSVPVSPHTEEHEYQTR